MHIPDPRNVTPWVNRTFLGGDNQVVDGMVPAGPWRRLLAYILDGVVVSLTLGLLLLITGVDPLAEAVMVNAMGGVCLWFYLSLLQMTEFQTVGKRLLGIRVATADGAPLTTSQAFLRNVWVLFQVTPVLSWITSALGVVILLSIFVAPQLQGVHDRIARTAVIVR